MPVIADDDVPKGWAFAIRKASWVWFQVEDPDWLKSRTGRCGTSRPGRSPGRAGGVAGVVQVVRVAGVPGPNQTGAIPGDAADDAAVNY
jgi:hypothetical protein